MGEAKRRALVDSTFGIVPRQRKTATINDRQNVSGSDDGPHVRLNENERGLIICPPMEIEGSSFRLKSTNLDPQGLRFSILFWDRLVWPSSNVVYIESGADESRLEKAGVLCRPNYTIWGDLAQGMARSQIQAFIDLETRQPGLWSLSQGEDSLMLKDNALSGRRGAFIELVRAIPVPAQDVPIDEIIEFKNRRHDDLMRLRSEIDRFSDLLNGNGDSGGNLEKYVAEIDAACADVMKIGRDWKYPMHLANLKCNFELNPMTALGCFAAGLKLMDPLALPITSLVVGAGAAVASTLRFKTETGGLPVKFKMRPSPYRYVSLFHKEIFNK